MLDKRSDASHAPAANEEEIIHPHDIPPMEEGGETLPF